MQFSTCEVELVMVPNFCCHVDLQSSHAFMVPVVTFLDVVEILKLLVPFNLLYMIIYDSCVFQLGPCFVYGNLILVHHTEAFAKKTHYLIVFWMGIKMVNFHWKLLIRG